MEFDVCFFKLVDGLEGVAELVGIADAVVFAAGDLGDFFQGFGVELLLWVCLHAVGEAAFLRANGDGVDFDSEGGGVFGGFERGDAA